MAISWFGSCKDVDTHSLVSFSTFKGSLRQKCKNGFLARISMGLDKAVRASHDKMSPSLWVITCRIWPCQPKPVPVTGTLFPLSTAFYHKETDLLSTTVSPFLNNYLDLHTKHRGMSQQLNNHLAKFHYQQASGKQKISKKLEDMVINTTTHHIRWVN